MKNTIIRVMGPALILAALLVASCGNIFEEPVQRGSPAAGRGVARISIGGKTAGGRTLMPDYQALYYVLTFTQGEKTVPAFISNGSTTDVDLDEGTWALDVKGYLEQADAENNPEYPVLTGAADGPVVITSGGKTDVTVTLTPFENTAGIGTLVFDLKFPASVNQAALRVEPWAGGAAKDLNLLDTPYKTTGGSAGRVDLDEGYYRLKYTLVTTNSRALKRSTVVHIYHNQVTSFKEEFDANDFTEAFVPVTGITWTPPAGLLTGDVIDLRMAAVDPLTATNTDIVWSVADAGGTGISDADLAGGTVTVNKAGTLKLAAAVKGGAGGGADYERPTPFTITITLRPQVEKPTANPAGSAVTTIEPIMLATATTGADIYYTTDGSDPDKTKTKYENPITLPVGNPVTLKAIAIKAAMTDSEVLTETYTVTLPVVATPTATPAGGTTVSPEPATAGATVELATTTVDAEIWYTTDGTAPSAGTGTKYAGPIPLSEGTVTLKAIAVKAGWAPSPVLTAVYDVTSAVVPYIEFYSMDYSSGTEFDIDQWTGQDTDTQGWTLTAGEHNTVYFAVYKDAAQTITVTNVDSKTDSTTLAKVTITETGSVAGALIDANGNPAALAASDTQAVFSVDTADLVFDGGDRVFTLKVTEAGALFETVTVTLKVKANTTGAAAFKVNWPTTPATPYGDLDLAELTTAPGGVYLTRIGPADPTGTPGAFTGLQEAIEYVDRNSTANTDYLIRVEKDELLLPKFYLTFCDEENVTLRLRGTGNAPAPSETHPGGWILKHSGQGTPSYNDKTIGGQFLTGLGGTTNGFFTLSIERNYSSYPKSTFILENNVTIKGVGKDQTQSPAYASLIKVNDNAMFVMKKGSKLTEFTSTTSMAGFSVIFVKNSQVWGSATPAADRQGYVRIEGGSITDCTFDTSMCGLIYLEGYKTLVAPGIFYMAASEDNSISFSGNVTNIIYIFMTNPKTANDKKYAWNGNLASYLTNGLTLPPFP